MYGAPAVVHTPDWLPETGVEHAAGLAREGIVRTISRAGMSGRTAASGASVKCQSLFCYGVKPWQRRSPAEVAGLRWCGPQPPGYFKISMGVLPPTSPAGMFAMLIFGALRRLRVTILCVALAFETLLPAFAPRVFLAAISHLQGRET